MVILPAQQLVGAPLMSQAFIHGPWPSQRPNPEAQNAIAVVMGVLVFGFIFAGIVRSAIINHDRREAERRAKKQGLRPGRGPYLPTHNRHRHRRW